MRRSVFFFRIGNVTPSAYGKCLVHTEDTYKDFYAVQCMMEDWLWAVGDVIRLVVMVVVAAKRVKDDEDEEDDILLFHCLHQSLPLSPRQTNEKDAKIPEEMVNKEERKISFFRYFKLYKKCLIRLSLTSFFNGDGSF